ncbi:MAG TPA: regulatory signaling modulator protein AmpE [Gammaproteobacteria bacterium]|nr:regulatory signaling modulator protein AmpE [Gammaproteobacteria bacterium]
MLVVFLCLGPKDLASEVDEYCAALDRDDYQDAQRALTGLAESRHSLSAAKEVVEEAVFMQATNRVFGVLFWFTLLGPVGAWLFAVSNFMRRRTVFEASRDAALRPGALPAAERLHGILAWAPARLAALGYALSGSFDDAINGWRSYSELSETPFHQGNERLVAIVGKAAMTGYLEQPANSSAAARNSLRLVMRTLFIWLTVIALMTLFGWAV